MKTTLRKTARRILTGTIATVCAAALLGSSAAHAATFYWDNDAATPGFSTASGTWSTSVTTVGRWVTDSTGSISGNLSQTTANTDSFNFGSGTAGLGAGSITVGTAVAGNITYSSLSGAIVLTGGTLTLAAAQTTTVNNTSDTINSVLAGAATSFTKAGTGILILGGTNTYTGSTIVNTGTLRAGATAGGQAFGNLSAVSLANVSGVILDLNNFSQTIGSLAGGGANGGNVSLGSATLTTGGKNSGTSYAGIISGAPGNLTKTGTGTQTLTGANTYAGTTTINAGAIDLGGGTATGSLASTVLTLSGGSFNYTRTGSTTQTFTTTNINSGTASALSVVSGNILNLGTVTRGTGGGYDFANAGAGTVAANSGNNLGGILPGFTFGNSWAVANGAGVAISGLADASYTLTSAAGITAGNYTGFNIDVDNSAGALDAAITANSLRFSAAAANTLILTGTNVVTTGGILVGSAVGSNLSTINGGTLAGAASKDLTVIQNNTAGGLTIDSVIANNGGATALTKSGAGLLTLSNSNTFTGGLFMNSGVVVVGNAGALNGTAGSENAMTFNAGSTGTLALAGNSVVLRSLSTTASNPGSAIVENASATPITLTIGNSLNLASTFAGVIQDGTGGGALTLTKAGTGILTLSGANSFSGGVVINAGTLTLSGANSFSGGIVMNAGILSVALDTYLGDAANVITFNGSATITPASVTYARAITLNNGAIASFNGSNPTFTGNVTGTGGVANASGFGNQVTFNGTGNTFEGPVTIGSTGITGQAYRFIFNSFADSATAKGRIKFIASSVTHADGSVFEYKGSSDLMINNRQFEIASTGSTPTNGHQIRNNSVSSTLTISTDLIVSSTTAQTLSLAGSSTGLSTFAGNITNGSSSAVSLTKAGVGTWALSGTNTYSGTTIHGFSNPATGSLIFQGIQALSPNTTLQQTHLGGVGGFGPIKILDDAASPASRSSVNLVMIASNTSHVMNLFVGNNNTANGGNSAGTTTGSTITLGNLNLTQTVVGNTSQTLALTGADGYRLQIGNVRPTLNTGFAGAYTVRFSPTSAPLTIAGNVQKVANASTGTIILNLDGTNSGNLITGNILNSADAPPTALSLTKTNTSTWTLSGTNSYSGGMTISGGILNVNADTALGAAAGAVAISNGATLQAGGTVTTAARTITLGTGGGVIDTNGNTVNLDAGSTVTGTTLTKTGAGTLNLAGTQTYATLTTGAGITNVNSALGTGTSTVNANATTNFGVSQTLAVLNIGDGAVLTLGSGAFAPEPGEAPGFAFEDGAAGMSPGVAAVPEPGSIGLLLVGSLGLLARRRRRGSKLPLVSPKAAFVSLL